MCATHGRDAETFTSLALFDEISSANGITSKLSSLTLSGSRHIFNILHKIQSDKFFERDEPTLHLSDEFFEHYGSKLKKMVGEWLPAAAASDPATLVKKTEEAIWMNTLIYGVGGWAAGKNFVADFAS